MPLLCIYSDRGFLALFSMPFLAAAAACLSMQLLSMPFLAAVQHAIPGTAQMPFYAATQHAIPGTVQIPFLALFFFQQQHFCIKPCRDRYFLSTGSDSPSMALLRCHNPEDIESISMPFLQHLLSMQHSWHCSDALGWHCSDAILVHLLRLPKRNGITTMLMCLFWRVPLKSSFCDFYCLLSRRHLVN